MTVFCQTLYVCQSAWKVPNLILKFWNHEKFFHLQLNVSHKKRRALFHFNPVLVPFISFLWKWKNFSLTAFFFLFSFFVICIIMKSTNGSMKISFSLDIAQVMLMRGRRKRNQQQFCAKKIDNDLIELISHRFYED